ncbi:MAG TPA: ATPase, T2SS/T4P/T4SS family [Mycobacteriales bacterium]|nr:ATPase, T2SS/T4P/T4SS family [Mycobacteriales bacterium]
MPDQIDGLAAGLPAQHSRLGELLVAAGVIEPDQLRELLAEQSRQPDVPHSRIGEMLVSRGLATERDIARGLAKALNLESSDLTNAEVAPHVARLLPRSVAERSLVLPISLDDDVLIVAMHDPTDIVALDDVRIYTKVRTIRVVVATPTAIRVHLNRVWSLGESAEIVSLGGADDDYDDGTAEDDTAGSMDDAPVVRLVHEILSDAARASASDIHLQPDRAGLRIRYRVDGLLRDVMNVPRSSMSALTSRIKIVSGLDIAERRRGQDGRTRLEVDGRQIDARVSTLPTMHGEKVVIRLLNRTEGVVPLNLIGLEEDQLEIFLETLVAPQGLIVVTGPTGSGKTSTLYSAVTQVRTPDRNLVSLEDPVEVQLPGVSQVQVRERAGMTFASGLRSILRQDPDVILVGEVRDQETAELALRASLTGHLVLTTLHTNDAASAVTRLVDMGVDTYLIASSMALVVAQRLVRIPCGHCSSEYRPSPRTLELLGLTSEDVLGSPLRRGSGCDACGATGYLGRTAIFELLPVDARMRAVLTASPTEAAIRAAARAAGAGSLRAHGIAKALCGETTLEEVLRVTQVDAGSISRCGPCRRVVDNAMTYCPWCSEPTDRHVCTTCSARLEVDWRHCPWCRAAIATPAPPPPVMPAASPARPARARILVVDDDPAVTAAVSAALNAVGDVVTAATAEQALRACSIDDLDAVVLDLHLPDLSGVETTRLLRNDPRTNLLPLVLMTSSADAALLAEARRAGVDDVIAKPVDPVDLGLRVTTLLARSSVVG